MFHDIVVNLPEILAGAAALLTAWRMYTKSTSDERQQSTSIIVKTLQDEIVRLRADNDELKKSNALKDDRIVKLEDMLKVGEVKQPE